jgi:alpha-acetolactate decarboxylase
LLKGKTMCTYKTLLIGAICLPGTFGGLAAAADDAETWDGKLVQYGKMHDAVGRQQHQGRVQLRKLVERPHFFGVAALEGLDGEITICDGKVTLTRVDANGQLEPSEAPDLTEKATLLIGAYVPSWTEHRAAGDVDPDDLDRYIAELAAEDCIDVSKPFVFTAEGEFSNLRLHVIHGACPLHARLRKIELPKERQPYELEAEKVRGTLVGVFAKDAVGNITHPDTSTHIHLVYQDGATGTMVTGHVEQIGLIEGAVVRLPK